MTLFINFKEPVYHPDLNILCEPSIMIVALLGDKTCDTSKIQSKSEKGTTPTREDTDLILVIPKSESALTPGNNNLPSHKRRSFLFLRSLRVFLHVAGTGFFPCCLKLAKTQLSGIPYLIQLGKIPTHPSCRPYHELSRVYLYTEEQIHSLAWIAAENVP